MEAKLLFKLKTPELRKLAAEMNPPLEIPIRWGKPKILKAIMNAQNQQKTVQADDYSEFINAVQNPPETVQNGQGSPEPIGDDEAGPGRGGVRPGAGNKPGNTAAAVRLKRAMDIKAADVNIRSLFHRISMFNKKKAAAAADVVDGVSLYTTKAAEYFGMMERAKNTPAFIFVALVYWLYRLFIHIRGNNESASKDNTSIRTAGDGEKQSGSQPVSEVQPNSCG